MPYVRSTKKSVQSFRKKGDQYAAIHSKIVRYPNLGLRHMFIYPSNLQNVIWQLVQIRIPHDCFLREEEWTFHLYPCENTSHICNRNKLYVFQILNGVKPNIRQLCSFMIPNNQNITSQKNTTLRRQLSPLLNSHISTNFLSPAVHSNAIRFISGTCYVKHEVLQQLNGGITEAIATLPKYMFEGTRQQPDYKLDVCQATREPLQK